MCSKYLTTLTSSSYSSDTSRAVWMNTSADFFHWGRGTRTRPARARLSRASRRSGPPVRSFTMAAISVSLIALGYRFSKITSRFIVSPHSTRPLISEAFADMIGKSWSFMAKIESPTRAFGVSMDTLFKIADVLQVPTSKLFED